MLRFSQERQIEWHYIAPGKPTQNVIESFNAPAARRTPQRDGVHLARAGSSGAGGLKRLSIPAAQCLGNLTPTEYANCGVPGPQRGGTLRYVEGSAPRPVAPPSPLGSNTTGTLPIAE